MLVLGWLRLKFDGSDSKGVTNKSAFSSVLDGRPWLWWVDCDDVAEDGPLVDGTGSSAAAEVYRRMSTGYIFYVMSLKTLMLQRNSRDASVLASGTAPGSR